MGLVGPLDPHMISGIVVLYHQPNLRKDIGSDFDLNQITFLGHLILLVANASVSVNIPEAVAQTFNVIGVFANSNKSDMLC